MIQACSIEELFNLGFQDPATMVRAPFSSFDNVFFQPSTTGCLRVAPIIGPRADGLHFVARPLAFCSQHDRRPPSGLAASLPRRLTSASTSAAPSPYSPSLPARVCHQPTTDVQAPASSELGLQLIAPWPQHTPAGVPMLFDM